MRISDEDLVAVVLSRLKNKFDEDNNQDLESIAEFLVETEMVTQDSLWPDIEPLTDKILDDELSNPDRGETPF